MIFTFGKTTYYIDKVIGAFYTNTLCLKSKCFEKPEGWNNIKDSLMFMSFFTDNKLSDEPVQHYMLTNIDNTKVLINYGKEDFTKLPDTVIVKTFEDKCTYAYEEQVVNQQSMLTLAIKEHNIVVTLPNDEIIINTMLSSICQ
ncbi:hypothetical protein [Sulfurovum sp.]|uniref:hypothetical protein n=1 Tax=Sulfurovum sp. TaxID=1969726 RepID=UPI00356489CE